ncbi:MAG: 4-(cytidine 5'-diphospho)-2-C-methyl-D-erythritol kinase [Candidatus Riflebacteria bacterium]|nr:4-(cytidine 5'-diphospho)-2-C-methyl-D-erythritol kinase [Candidatus Riflebacteria bacterium]
MTGLELEANAKVNLHLAVGERRPDGYHEIETVFSSVSLSDRLVIERAPGSSRLELDVDGLLAVPVELNLAYRAGQAFLNRIGAHGEGLRLRLAKRIPAGAGLGGGSADAAAALVGLDLLFDSPLAASDLALLARELGADVAFCLRGGLALGRGIGDVLEFFEISHPQPHLVIVKPPQQISTAWAYRALDDRGARPAPASLDRVRAALHERGPAGLGGVASNDFEPVAFGEHPRLRMIRDHLLAAGAEWAMLTGSGAALFGVCRTEAAAAGAAHAVAAALPADHQVILCRGMDRGVVVS